MSEIISIQDNEKNQFSEITLESLILMMNLCEGDFIISVPLSKGGEADAR